MEAGGRGRACHALVHGVGLAPIPRLLDKGFDSEPRTRVARVARRTALQAFTPWCAFGSSRPLVHVRTWSLKGGTVKESSRSEPSFSYFAPRWLSALVLARALRRTSSKSCRQPRPSRLVGASGLHPLRGARARVPRSRPPTGREDQAPRPPAARQPDLQALRVRTPSSKLQVRRTLAPHPGARPRAKALRAPRCTPHPLERDGAVAINSQSCKTVPRSRAKNRHRRHHTHLGPQTWSRKELPPLPARRRNVTAPARYWRARSRGL